MIQISGLLDQLKDKLSEEGSHWFSIFEPTAPTSTVNPSTASPESEAGTLPDSDSSTQLSPTIEKIPDVFSVGSFISKTPEVNNAKPELLYVLSDDTTRDTYLLQEHNYTMKLQLADLALMYNLELCCDINKHNKEIVYDQRRYETEWNTFMSEDDAPNYANYEKAQLAITWMRKAFRKRYTVKYKPSSQCW